MMTQKMNDLLNTQMQNLVYSSGIVSPSDPIDPVEEPIEH